MAENQVKDSFNSYIVNSQVPMPRPCTDTDYKLCGDGRWDLSLIFIIIYHLEAVS